VETLTTDLDDGVLTVELCRPDLHNRFDHLLHDELDAVLDQAAVDERVRAVLLVAQGQVFSGGGDTDRMLEAHAKSPHALLAEVDRGRRLFRVAADFPKPLVVGLHGDVFGVATSIILLADAIVSMPGVRICDPHVHMGLVAGDGGAIAWPTNLSATMAKRHLLWGEALVAEDAHRLGVVTDLEPSVDAVRARAKTLATRVAALPPVAVQLTKRALNQTVAARIAESFDLGFYLEAMTLGTQDMVEAVNAFLEKRRGSWKGR
jgi:enoyl-CoA hydratase/carnithine racemase